MENGDTLAAPQRTSLQILSSQKFSFNEPMVFPVRICDLGPSCELTLSIFSCNQPLPQSREVSPEYWKRNPTLLTSVSHRLYDEKKCLRVGTQAIPLDDKEPPTRLDLEGPERAPNVEWLDKLNRRKLQERSETLSAYISIELPKFQHKVIYQESVMSKCDSSETIELVESKALPFDYLVCDPIQPGVTPSEVLSQRMKIAEEKCKRPNKDEKKRLNRIINTPSKSYLSKSDKRFLFSFRYYCKDDPKALTKFLQCVDWENEIQTEEALFLMQDWAEVQWPDALELLSKRFRNPDVRQFAVEVLSKSDDQTFHSFVMELVKALRNEPSYPSPLSNLLIQNSTRSNSLCSWLYWNLKTESLGNVRGARKAYQSCVSDFRDFVALHAPDLMADIARQEWLVKELTSLSARLQTKSKAKEKESFLRQIIRPEGEFSELFDFPDPVRLLTKPDVLIYGIRPEKCRVFQSKLCPLKIAFRTEEDRTESVMWKSGDDLRQDQMIIQLLQLMDQLLRQENLDMDIISVPILATSPDSGFMEFIENQSALAKVLMNNNNDIRQSLRKTSPDLDESLHRYARSCAGYSVIMYILGIGDRHLDNILLKHDGRIVHIDFGFVFGDDPFPRVKLPMKLTKEMIAAMDGPYYEEFLRSLFLVYKCLRRNASLILNLIMLMTSHEENSFLRNATSYVEEKLALGLSDAQCESHLLHIVQVSNAGIGAVFARMLDKAHDWNTKRR